MERADLERLDRATLIARAEALGVGRANILTRPELVDELLVRTAAKGDKDLPRARGFFGRARDLLARVIERGLHLPDAAERLRKVGAAASSLAARVVPAVIPTVTLAEIYAAQGYRGKAIDTLKRVLELEPEHETAKSLLTKLEEAERAAPSPPTREHEASVAPPPRDGGAPHAAPLPAIVPAPPPAPLYFDAPVREPDRGEPLGFLDDEPLPERYDTDECVAIAVDPVTLYVYWEIRAATVEHIQRTRSGAGVTLRLLIITPSWDGPRSVTRDIPVDTTYGDFFIRDLPAGSVVRAAIGFTSGQAFVPVAHAAALETPPGSPCPMLAEEILRWTPQGRVRVTPSDADYRSIHRALGRLGPRRDAGAPRYARLDQRPAGSSEASAGFSAPSRGDRPAPGSSEASGGFGGSRAPSSHTFAGP